jgi:hypothetical protein
MGQRVHALLFRLYLLPAKPVRGKPDLDAGGKLVAKVEPQAAGGRMRHIVQRKVHPESSAFAKERSPVEGLEFAEAGGRLFECQAIIFRKHGYDRKQGDLRYVRRGVFHQHGRLYRGRLVLGTERHRLRHAAHRRRLGKDILASGRSFGGRRARYDVRHSGRQDFRRHILNFCPDGVRRRIERGRRGKDEPEQEQDTGQTKISKLWHGVDV